MAAWKDTMFSGHASTFTKYCPVAPRTRLNAEQVYLPSSWLIYDDEAKMIGFGSTLTLAPHWINRSPWEDRIDSVHLTGHIVDISP